MNANGNFIAEYTWGLLGPIVRHTPSESRYYIPDGLGHTRLLLDNQGTITDTYVYDAWGNALSGTAGNTPNPFTWNGAFGYVFVPFTGLYHVGAREYDPRTARWLQRDPIGVAGGHPNVYLYCANDPVNGKDPSGLQPDDDNPYAGFGHGVDEYGRQFRWGPGVERAQKSIGQVKTVAQIILECYAITQLAKLYYDRDCSGKPLSNEERTLSVLQAGLSIVPGFGVIGAVLGHSDEAVKLAHASFASGKLRSHFVKHSLEVGAKTEAEYLQKARDIITRRHLFVFRHTTKNGDMYFYDMLTNEFAVVAPDCATLRTYFTPSNKWNYWLRQLQK